jgi:hypothetical protein
LLKRREGRRGGEAVALGPVFPPGAAVGHDHDHGRDLSVGQQVIEEDVGPGDVLPFRLVAGVLQVQHGITHLAIGVVTGRGVDEDAPPCLGRFKRFRAETRKRLR